MEEHLKNKHDFESFVKGVDHVSEQQTEAEEKEQNELLARINKGNQVQVAMFTFLLQF